ncbi:MAG: 5'-3' exonuclease H3TH domain-containing protein, partial [Egibacteraceae bacterium]
MAIAWSRAKATACLAAGAQGRPGADRVGWVESPAHEADEVIATLVARAAGRARAVLSMDKDFSQLIDEQVTVVNTVRTCTRAVVDRAEVIGRYGVQPRQWCDFRALTGDPADNVPGVRGIGPVRAARLLADGVTLEQARAAGRLTGAASAAVERAWAKVLAWRALIRLQVDLNLPAVPPRPAVTAADLPSRYSDRSSSLRARWPARSATVLADHRLEQRGGHLGAGHRAVRADERVGLEVVRVTGGEGVRATDSEQASGGLSDFGSLQRSVSTDPAVEVVGSTDGRASLTRKPRRDRVRKTPSVSTSGGRFLGLGLLESASAAVASGVVEHTVEPAAVDH